MLIRHIMQGPPGWRCSCGTSFADHYALAEHVRRSIACPRCGASPCDILNEAKELHRWTCGHWIARHDLSATLRDDDQEKT